MSLKDYGLEGERLRRAVYLDAMEDYQLGDDQACLNYPMRYPTVEFELVDTIGLCEIVDTIRKGKGYRPVLEEGGDTSAWYSMYLGLNGYTTTGLDTSILAIVVNSDSEDNPIINSTMRDYLASEVSEDICRRYIFPEDVMKAHDEGIIHIHDLGYVSGPISNCELVNLEDMLQNGTVITNTLIEKPHSFSTACNIATQIIAQVASNTYGGQTISLAHLAPFVDVSRQKYRYEVRAELTAVGEECTEAKINHIAEMRVLREIERGVQTIQYQIQTLLTTNGQTPFVSVFMYLDEVPEGQTRDDLALIIEETLHQRWQGVKNETGVWISPAFPKLIYVLDEDNISEESPYWYLTELAAQCTARRMVPDYISAKVMKKLKNGDPL